MTTPGEGHEITHLLDEWRGGNQEALDRLSPIVHQELRRIAAAYVHREHSDHTLQPTALINEASVRLLGPDAVAFSTRAHFCGVASQGMRRIMVDLARRVSARRVNGSPGERSDAIALSVQQSHEILAVHQALDRLAAFDGRKARIMEMRHFGGLSRDQIAEVAGLSLDTVERDMHLAGAWLKRDITLSAAASA